MRDLVVGSIESSRVTAGLLLVITDIHFSAKKSRILFLYFGFSVNELLPWGAKQIKPDGCERNRTAMAWIKFFV
jgi:hypothetical protein